MTKARAYSSTVYRLECTPGLSNKIWSPEVWKANSDIWWKDTVGQEMRGSVN